MVFVLIIAASLPDLELQPGMPLPELENNELSVASGGSRTYESISLNRFFIILFVIYVAGMFLYVMYKLLRNTDWKSLGAVLKPILIISLFIFCILFLIMLMPKSPAPAETVITLPTPVPLVYAPLGPPPPVLLWLVGFALLITGVLIVIWIIRSNSGRKSAIDLVGLEAEKAWQELKIGVGLKDVIIKCYRQMSLALEKEKGIQREKFMTTGEFEILLQAAGVPHDPVHQLTQLFEAARYGDWQPNPADEQKAIYCLEAIIAYSREAKEMD